MPSAEAAIAAIEAAANDTDALQEAVQEAAFLDPTPGENRQKLRAARVKLRRLRAEEAAKIAKKLADRQKNSADNSPWIKDTYDAAEFDTLVEKYEKLQWRMISKPGGATVKPDEFYEIYGFAKQAQLGNNTTERPMWAEKGGLDFDGRARWDAWTAIKGMGKEKAKLQFVTAYYEFTPKALYKDDRGTL